MDAVLACVCGYIFAKCTFASIIIGQKFAIVHVVILLDNMYFPWVVLFMVIIIFISANEHQQVLANNLASIRYTNPYNKRHEQLEVESGG